MDFGQLPIQTPFDPSLAPLTRTDLARIAKPNASPETKPLFVGAPQWTVPAWKGKTYPRGTKPSEFLDAYSRQWNAIELNSSFYSWPSAEQVGTWASRTPADFRFFVKVHQDLSHDREIYGNAELLRAKIHAFQMMWKNLGARWGGTFLQLPPYFSAHDLPKLRTWLHTWKTALDSPALDAPALPGAENLHVEVRHESFFQNRRLIPALESLLTELRIGAVCTDTPGRRDVSHATLTTDFWIVRFLVQSTEKNEAIIARDLERLDAWALRLAELTKRGLKGFAFFTHNPDHVWAPELSTRFTEKFLELLGDEKSLASHLRAPTPLNEEPDQLGFSL